MARDIGDGEDFEFDVNEAGSWSDEDYEANVLYLLDRGGDVDGTTENGLLRQIIGEEDDEKFQEELNEYKEKRASQVAGTPPGEVTDGTVPADDFVPDPEETAKVEAAQQKEADAQAKADEKAAAAAAAKEKK